MSSGPNGNKRPYTETVVEVKLGYVKIVDEEVRKLMGGVKFGRGEELKEAFLKSLKSRGAIKDVKGLVEVTVQKMTGASFGVMLEEGGGSNSSVRALKAEIEEAEGASCHRQELFMLVEDAEEGSEEPLSDDFEIESACTVALCVRPEAEWEWDATSEMVKDCVFFLSGPNNSIATKIDRVCGNCMMVERVMGAGTGKHTISMKLAQGSAKFRDIYCGVVRDGAPCNANHAIQKSTVGWFMDTCAGQLTGNCANLDVAGCIASGRVLTMQLDTDAGTLKFWVDGKHHGSGYTSGVTGSLRWATSVGYEGNAVEIVPTPELEYES
jgi:hypothetical protein